MRLVPISSEKVERLKATKEVLRELYLKSGNLCVFLRCVHLMMDADGNFIDEVFHIEAAEKGGRFNPTQSNEDLRVFSNLMFMCGYFHKENYNVKKFTVEIVVDSL